MTLGKNRKNLRKARALLEPVIKDYTQNADTYLLGRVCRNDLARALEFIKMVLHVIDKNDDLIRQGKIPSPPRKILKKFGRPRKEPMKKAEENSKKQDDGLFKKLGSCCICGTRENVHTIILLNRKCKIPGHGWGCVVCSLPSDGAVAVLCDKCFPLFQKGEEEIKWACKGYPHEGRIPVAELSGIHEHNKKIHSSYEKSIGSLN